MQSHNEEPKVKSNICDQSFKTSNSLHQHMKLHRKSEEVICNLCDKVLFSRSASWKHHKIQHELIEFLCPYCWKHFTINEYCIKHTEHRKSSVSVKFKNSKLLFSHKNVRYVKTSFLS